MEYSCYTLIVFHQQHLMYHPPASFPENAVIIVAVVSAGGGMWAVLFM